MFGREKKHLERLGRRKTLEKSLSSVWGVLGLFIAPVVNFEAAALEGPLKALQGTWPQRLPDSEKILAS